MPINDGENKGYLKPFPFFCIRKKIDVWPTFLLYFSRCHRGGGKKKLAAKVTKLRISKPKKAGWEK